MAPAVADAVNTVALPLAVCVGLNAPQVAAGVQVQSTPAAAVSLLTVAAMDAVPLAVSVAGGGVVIATVIAGGVTLRLVLLQAEIVAARISVKMI